MSKSLTSKQCAHVPLFAAGAGQIAREVTPCPRCEIDRLRRFAWWIECGDFENTTDLQRRAHEVLGGSPVETSPPHPDTARLDWLQAKPDHFANIDRITSVNGKFNGYATLREAIDRADELRPVPLTEKTRFYASLIGPLLGVYYPLPFDNELQNRTAMNTSRLSKLWHNIYTRELVEEQIKQFGGLILPQKFVNILDYDSFAVNCSTPTPPPKPKEP